MSNIRPETEAVWINLARTYKMVLEGLEQALKDNDLPSLEVYDVLLEVERAGNAGIRPFELKKRLLLPQYSTSRILDRFAKQGLIEKIPSKDDKRGFVVRLSPQGRKLRKRMWPIYSKSLQSIIQERHSLSELRDAARRLEALGAASQEGR